MKIWADGLVTGERILLRELDTVRDVVLAQTGTINTQNKVLRNMERQMAELREWSS